MNAVQFCELVEAQLGWRVPSNRGPRWKALSIEASKVTRQMASNPKLYTWGNLQLAVALLHREKQSRTPVGVFAHVDRALDLAMDKEDGVEAEIREVMRYETMRGDPQGWVVRFARAEGAYRPILLREWQESVR